MCRKFYVIHIAV